MVSIHMCVHVYVWRVYANMCVVYIMHVYIYTNVMYTHAHTYTHTYMPGRQVNYACLKTLLDTLFTDLKIQMYMFKQDEVVCNVV